MSTKALKHAKEIKEREGGLILPPPFIPSQVTQSRVESPPPPVADDRVAPEPIVEEKEIEEVKKEEVVGEEIGTITVHLWRNKPYAVDFEGSITGEQISIAWRAIFKQYRLWKHNLSKGGK